MATDIFKIFTNLGLTDSETKVYLASLSLGPTSVQDIARKSRLSRTATYDTVKGLKDRGLLSTFERGKKTFFAAEDPDRVMSYFKGNVEQMKDELKTLQKVMPEMKLMAGGEKPAVRFYEGDEAIFALFSDLGKVKPDTLYEVTNLDAVNEFVDQDLLAEARKLAKPIKNVKVLHTGKAPAPRPHVKHTEFPKGTIDFTGDIWIYGNRVAFVSFIGKVVTVIIENKPFSDTAKALFDTAWKIGNMKK